jgi:hypothetical protein
MSSEFAVSRAPGLHLALLLIGLNAVAGQAQESSDRRAGVRVTANPGNVTYYTPERWGTLKLAISNSRNEPVELLCSTYFEGEDTLQYGRRVWLPPNSKLDTTHLIRAPRDRTVDQQFWELRTLVLDPQQDRETLVNQKTGELQSPCSLRVSGRTPVTMLLARGDPMDFYGSPSISLSDLVLTARYQLDQAENMIYLTEELCPPSEEALDAVDQIIIADDRPLRDLAGLTAIRRWLHGGGRLWIMLDRVAPALCEALLGDEWGCQIVDRVTLAQVAYGSPQSPGKLTNAVDFEIPVELVRVLANDVDVISTVDGWPAVMWINYGQGQLVLTAIGGDALVRRRTAEDRPRRADGSRQTAYLPEPVLDDLATQFFVHRNKLPIPAVATATHVQEQVGYAIPSWSLVVGLLTGFTVVLGGLGIWLSRSGRLEQFAIGATAAAIVAGGALVGAGQATRHAVPPTTATLQFVQPIPGTNDVKITGTVGVFSPDSGEATVAGTQGGWVVPQTAATAGVARRLVWTDIDNWQWEHLPQTPGLHTSELHQTRVMSVPSRATLTFNERGAVGRLLLPEGIQPSDAAVVTTTGRIGVEIGAGGSLTAAADQVLSREQYLPASVLNDEQHRRSRLLQELFTSKEGLNFPTQPTLLFWSDAWLTGLQLLEPSRHTGSALVALPISIVRPPAGTEILIPWPLLPFRETSGPDQPTPVGLYNYRIRQWMERHEPMSTWLQFQVPPAALPLEAQSAKLVVQVNGPVGKLSVSGLRDGVAVPIHTWTDPVGTLTWNIDEPELLSLSREGQLKLRIAGGDPDRPELTAHRSKDASHVSYWQIESLTLELRARVTD